MTAPDLPMTPPIREAWQRRRKATWPGGMTSGGGGGFENLERLEDPFGGNGFGSGKGGTERFAGGERKFLSIIQCLLLLLLLSLSFSFSFSLLLGREEEFAEIEKRR